MTTNLSGLMSVLVERNISGSVAAARQNTPGAADENGVTMQAWVDHHDGQMRALAKMVDCRLGACADMEKALHGSAFGLDTLAKGGDAALAKVWADTRAVQAALVAERPAFEALAKRIADYLAEPASRPGSPSYGTPLHLIGRAIH